MSSLASTHLHKICPASNLETDGKGLPSLVVLCDLSDEALLCRIQEGYPDGLAHLFHRYVHLVRAISCKILKNEPEAQDFVQDLFLFVGRKAEMFDSTKSSARSWIIQMTYQRAIERRRYLSARHFYDPKESQTEVDLLVAKPTTEDDYSPGVVFGRNGLHKVIEALTEDQRETLKLYFFEGYTFAEIAQKLGQTLGNVRNHYYRGLDKLREQMFVKNLRRT